MWPAGCWESSWGRSPCNSSSTDCVTPSAVELARELDPAEGQVPDAVTETLAALLEPGRRTLGGPWDEGPLGRLVAQQGTGAQHLEHVLGIGLPVGGEPQDARGPQACGQQLHERALHQSALVMAL